MFRSSTILRDLVQSLAKITLLLKHLVKLRRCILCGDVATCREMSCVLFVVQTAVCTIHRTHYISSQAESASIKSFLLGHQSFLNRFLYSVVNTSDVTEPTTVPWLALLHLSVTPLISKSPSTCISLILPRSRTGTVWFYTSTSNKRAARPKMYTKSLTRDLKLMYSRFTLVRISINL